MTRQRRRAVLPRPAAKAVFWLVALLLVAFLAVVAAPATLVAAGSAAAASRRGWEPRRLWFAAAWCTPMVGVWLAAAAYLGPHPAWLAAATAPSHAYLAFWRLVRAGSYPRAVATIAPAAVPLGLLGGALAWSYRVGSLDSGAGGRSPGSGPRFQRRQWDRQVRAARARIARSGSVPLTTRDDLIVAGAVIRAVGHRPGRVAAISYQRMRAHQIVVGMPGTGKTTLTLRLVAGFMTVAMRHHAAGSGLAPLVVHIDCKGGSDARNVAEQFRHAMQAAGARSVAIWPDESGLSLWTLPPDDLTTALVDLVEHGTGAAAYYTDMMDALIALAVQAPCGPPVSSRDLLARLEPGWLSAAYAATGSSADHASIRAAARQLSDVALRLRTLFRRLGDGMDGPGEFADADAWYCILEGTDQIAVAEAQARALGDLLANLAVRGSVRRDMLLVVDEFSAVSRRLPIWELFERARSLGLAVLVSAQSWQGLGSNDDQRSRLASSADGGIWLLRTPYPEPLTELAGNRPSVETTRRLGRYPFWRQQGTSRLGAKPVAEPDIFRRLDRGQTGYLYRGGVTYIQVKRLVTGPAAPPRAAPAGVEPAGGGPAGVAPDAAEGQPASGPPGPASRRALPDISSLLDEAFGPGPER
jgi:hypothetical protein